MSRNFFDEQRDDRHGCGTFDPPRARLEKLYQQPDYDDAGER
jgi:hypothetical protein